MKPVFCSESKIFKEQTRSRNAKSKFSQALTITGMLLSPPAFVACTSVDPQALAGDNLKIVFNYDEYDQDKKFHFPNIFPNECISASTVSPPELPNDTMNISYHEPKTLVDGKKLTNLDHTTIYYGPLGAKPTEAIVIGAGSQNGGTHIEMTHVPIPPHTEKLYVCVTASNKKEGPPAYVVKKQQSVGKN